MLHSFIKHPSHLQEECRGRTTRSSATAALAAACVLAKSGARVLGRAFVDAAPRAAIRAGRQRRAPGGLLELGLLLVMHRGELPEDVVDHFDLVRELCVVRQVRLRVADVDLRGCFVGNLRLEEERGLFDRLPAYPSACFLHEYRNMFLILC